MTHTDDFGGSSPDLLEGASPERGWSSWSRRQRTVATGAAVLLAAGAVIWSNAAKNEHPAAHPVARPAGSPIASPSPTVQPEPLYNRCLDVAATTHRVGYPETVLIGGRQLLRVDLATGKLTSLGPCHGLETASMPIPMSGARATWTALAFKQPTLRIAGPVGVSTIRPVAHEYSFAIPDADGDLLRVRVPNATGARIRVETYGPDGHMKGAMVTAPDVTGVFGSTVAGLLGSVAAPKHLTRLVLLDPKTGRVLRTIGVARWFMGADRTHVAWFPVSRHDVVDSDAVVRRCKPVCAALRVTDLLSGTTRSYGAIRSNTVTSLISFSPQGAWMLAIQIAPHHNLATMVSVIRLSDGAQNVLPGLHLPIDATDPRASWSTDGRALVIANVVRTHAHLLVWHEDNTLTPAATLVGDPYRLTVQVIGPGLTAWQ